MLIIINIFQNIVFPLKFIIGVIFFAPYLKRRSNFSVRVLISALICFLPCALIKPLFSEHSILFIFDAGVFLLLIMGMWFCFKNSIFSILFCGSVILALQQIAFNILTIFYLQFLIKLFREIGFEPLWFTYLWQIVHILLCCCSYVLVNILYMRKIEFNEELIQTNKAVVLIVLGLVELIFLCFFLIMRLYFAGTALYINLYLILTTCCLFVIGYLFSIFKYNKNGCEVEIMKKILSEKENQYAISKENIDIINRKCHDLKYIIAAYANQRNDNELNEMAEAVNLYGSVNKTGNAAIEVILSENYFICKDNNIELTCIADGNLLKFMSDTDVYTLLGNAISNAIEASLKVNESERYINLHIGKANKSDLVGIMIENSFNGQLNISNGDLESSKEKNGFHGYGVKSMEFIVEKYGGGFSFESKDKRFYINIVLPLPENVS